jgi:SPOR domain
VYSVTRRSAEEWAEAVKGAGTSAGTGEEPQSCLQLAALLRRPGSDGPGEAPFAPWGVQLAGNFSKDKALAAFGRARRAYASVVGDIRPMIIGTRLRYRGTRTFYRVRVPAGTRAAAAELCSRIRKSGGSCIVLPS